MKPSEAVSEHFHRIKGAAVADARVMVEAGGGTLTAEAEAFALQSAYHFAITRHLDAEHDRRAAFEADVLKRLGRLDEDRKHAMGGGLIGYTEHTDKVYGLSRHDEPAEESEGHKARDAGGAG